MLTLQAFIAAHYTTLVVSTGVGLLGAISGLVGCFALLRKQSLLGDTLSHAALPGIALAFLITKSKSMLFLLIGAGLAGLIAALSLIAIRKQHKLKEDAAQGIVLSVFFGFGMLLLNVIQNSPIENKTGLTDFLFGNAASMLIEDIYLIFLVSFILLSIVLLCYKEFKALCFDAEFFQSLGFSVTKLSILMNLCLVLAIVIGLQSVGVVLMSALIVAPAAGARQWTERLSSMALLALFFGASSGFLGVFTSSLAPRLSTGPLIVVFLSLFVLISLFFATKRGLVSTYLSHLQNKKKISDHRILANMLLFSETQKDPFFAHNLASLELIDQKPNQKQLLKLKNKGLLQNPTKETWALTQAGLKQAKTFLSPKENYR